MRESRLGRLGGKARLDDAEDAVSDAHHAPAVLGEWLAAVHHDVRSEAGWHGVSRAERSISFLKGDGSILAMKHVRGSWHGRRS
eukprot:6210972-Pleurochrysis_carterae.AAC.3